MDMNILVVHVLFYLIRDIYLCYTVRIKKVILFQRPIVLKSINLQKVGYDIVVFNGNVLGHA